MVSFVHSLAGEAFCVASVSGLQAQYAVTGFVWHGNDHYVAYLVHGQKWYCLNDAVVSEVAPGDLPSEACLVFLEKVVRLRAKSTRSCPRRSSPAPNALWLRLPEALAKAATQPLHPCVPAHAQQDRLAQASASPPGVGARLGKFASSVRLTRAIRNGEPRGSSAAAGGVHCGLAKSPFGRTTTSRYWSWSVAI